MLGYKQSPTLEAVDQAFLTRRRIVRHVQTALLVVFVAVAAFARSLPVLVVVSVLFSVACVLVRPGVQRLIN
jgi:hypothetical protein